MGKKVIYIAGPITGVERYWENFERAEDAIRNKGHIPLTPTRIPWDLSNDKAMKICPCRNEKNFSITRTRRKNK